MTRKNDGIHGQHFRTRGEKNGPRRVSRCGGHKMDDTKPATIPDKAAKNTVDEFMLAEYQTIAAAHFDLHNGLRQNFRFYLGLIAAPVTVFAVYKDPNIEVFKLPEVMLFLFSVISLLGFLMFLNMINTRFDIILYTRAVNGVRAYFKVRADEIGDTAFEIGRKLPVDKNKPPYNVVVGPVIYPQNEYPTLFCLPFRSQTPD
jgi:hypothetical protein